MKKYFFGLFLILFSSIILFIGCPPPDDFDSLPTSRPEAAQTPTPLSTPLPTPLQFPTPAPTLGPINYDLGVSVINLRNNSYIYSRRIFGKAFGTGIEKILVRIDYKDEEIHEAEGSYAGDTYEWHYDLPAGNNAFKYSTKHVIEVFSKDTNGSYSAAKTLFLTAGINRDINGDGYSDIVAGAPDYDNEETDEGRVYIFYGSSDGPAGNPPVTLEIDNEQAGFGYSVAFAGDVNGDGFGDIIAGAPDYSTGDKAPGAVFLYYGSENGIGSQQVPDWKAYGELDDDNFGCSLASAGHVNNDGYADVIIGAMQADVDNRNELIIDAGKAYIFHGSNEGLSEVPNLILTGGQSYAGFGTSVSSAGCMDSIDEYSDVIVGAPNYDGDTNTNQGRLSLYRTYPGDNLDNKEDKYFTINAENSFLGMSVCQLGKLGPEDVNSILAAAPGYNNNDGYTQIIYTYLLADWYSPETVKDSKMQLGSSVSTLGNINGDEYSDFIIGAGCYSSNDENNNCGAVFVYLGAESVDRASRAAGAEGKACDILESDPWICVGDQPGAHLGYGIDGLSSVGTAGDANGDGFSDVIFAAPYFDTEGGSVIGSGIIFVYYGTNDNITGINNNRDPWSFTGDQENGHLGSAVAK